MASKSCGIPTPIINPGTVRITALVQGFLFTDVCVYIPSALISFGPFVQIEDVGKFASARTGNNRRKHKLTQ